MEIATLVIAVVGLVLSLASWAYELWRKRRHLSVKIDFNADLAERYISSKYLNASIAFSFDNKSSNPIAVTYIQLVTQSGFHYRCNLEKSFVAHHFRPLIDTSTKFYENIIESAKFPIEIGAYGAAYEYIHFSLPRDFNAECIYKVLIMTNRGKVFISCDDVIERLKEFLGIHAEPRPKTQLDTQACVESSP